MNKKRPVNLDLRSFSYPPMAIASILHRISGLVLFLSFPFIIYLLGLSLSSEQGFNTMQELIARPCYKLFLWLFSAALMYHIVAGIRHVMMDLGWGEGLDAGRRSAVVAIVLAVILTIFMGIWIW